MTWFLKSAHFVLAKKNINQTVDFVGGLVLGSKKISIQIEPYRMVLFFAENNEQIYKMVCSFFLKNVNP